MPAYLTDAAFWVTVCAAHLLEIGARASGDDADETAADLFEDPEYSSLPPQAAAVAFQAWHRHARAARTATGSEGGQHAG